MADVSIPSAVSCGRSQCAHSFYNQYLSNSQNGFDVFNKNIKPLDYAQTGFTLGIKTMRDDIDFKIGPQDNDFYSLEQMSFKIVLNYRGNNNVQSANLWESFIGISPKNYRLKSSFVKQLKENGIPPVVALDINQFNNDRHKSYVNFGTFQEVYFSNCENEKCEKHSISRVNSDESQQYW